MVQGVCGGCYFQIDSRSQGQSIEQFCAYDETWHDQRDTCDKWRAYSGNISIAHRIETGRDLRNSKRIKVRDKSFAKRQWLIALASFVGGGLLVLLATWLRARWQ